MTTDKPKQLILGNALAIYTLTVRTRATETTQTFEEIIFLLDKELPRFYRKVKYARWVNSHIQAATAGTKHSTDLCMSADGYFNNTLQLTPPHATWHM
jgi:predicted RecA/RadA family phage recombinase